jgi:hypothetical protein
MRSFDDHPRASFEDAERAPAAAFEDRPTPPSAGGATLPLSFENTHVAERGAWSLVWLGVASAGFSTWGEWTSSSVLTVVAPVVVLVATAGLITSWMTGSPRSRIFQRLALAAVIVALVASQWGNISTRRYYTTDSAAFNQVAASSLVHGQDPYTVSMAPARRLLQVPDQYWTYTVDGGHVTDVSYPAGSFLVVAPAMLLGFHHAVVDWVDLLAWIVTAVLIFALLPTSLRWLAALLLLAPAFAGPFSSGGTDAPFLPFLVLVVWRWDRFGEGPEAGVARWLGPVALGMACSIKQTPWFCVPFLVAGVALEARRHGRRALPVATRYGATVAGVFAAVNLPFVVWDPRAWLHGTLTPFAQPLVADGQGLVSLATHGIVGGVDLTDLTVCGALVYLALLAWFVSGYPRLKRVWLLAVPVALFFSARSFSSYLVDFVPAALVATLSVTTSRTLRQVAPSIAARGEAVTSGRGGGRVTPARVVGAACALGGLSFGLLAFSGPPLQLVVRNMVVQSAPPSAGGAQLTAVTVTIRNMTASSELPHVLVDMYSHPAGFWRPQGEPISAIPPHGSTTLTLYPPSITYTSPGRHWVVQAYTTDPRALSTSAVQVTRPLPSS